MLKRNIGRHRKDVRPRHRKSTEHGSIYSLALFVVAAVGLLPQIVGAL